VEAPQSLHSNFLLKLQLESNPEALSLVRAAVERASEVLQFPEEEVRAIVRSVDEALANIIRHAYGGDKGKPIEVTCRSLRNDSSDPVCMGIEIVMQDEGTAADPGTFKSRPLDEIRPGGLGLHFMKASMDIVEFSRDHGKNQLRLVKYRTPDPPGVGPQGE
jgi:anti-sigma regulatory factor (Ser/Thr protein kinase)